MRITKTKRSKRIVNKISNAKPTCVFSQNVTVHGRSCKAKVKKMTIHAWEQKRYATLHWKQPKWLFNYQNDKENRLIKRLESKNTSKQPRNEQEQYLQHGKGMTICPEQETLWLIVSCKNEVNGDEKRIFARYVSMRKMQVYCKPAAHYLVKFLLGSDGGYPGDCALCFSFKSLSVNLRGAVRVVYPTKSVKSTRRFAPRTPSMNRTHHAGLIGHFLWLHCPEFSDR